MPFWEHREVVRHLRAKGRRLVNEHAIFAAVAEQRHTVAEAYARSKAARRSAAQGMEAQRVPVAPYAPSPGAAVIRPDVLAWEDAEARVPELTEEDIAALEFQP